MWKRIALLMLAQVLIMLIGCTDADRPNGIEVILKDKDTFYYDEYDNAIAITESSMFDIGYSVSRVDEQSEEGAEIGQDVYYVQYDLVLLNKSGKRITGLHFVAHMRESMQIMLASPNWYNEPLDLGGGIDDELPRGVFYGWTPSVILDDVAIVGGIALDDFYDMLIEIVWDDGREIVRLDRESAFFPASVPNTPDSTLALDEEDIAHILEMIAPSS